EGYEGSYRDAEDGELSMSNVEHGRVDSVIRFKMMIAPHDSKRVNYFLTASHSARESLDILRRIQESSIAKRMYITAKYWHKWLKPVYATADKLPHGRRQEFLRSAMLLKAHIDKRGAIIASTDSAMLNYGRDAYAYCWPRDGAYVVWPLIRLGYIEEPQKFFSFCKRILHSDGYFSHKYRADGAIGSSWHPYLHKDGSISAPIQTDETAMILFMFVQFYQSHPDQAILRDYYPNFIRPMADFLSTYIEPRTSLPKASYDLWEEKYLTTTYTTAVTYAALIAAAEIAEAYQQQADAVTWHSAADDMKKSAEEYLYNKSRNVFYKGIKVTEETISFDETIDVSSVFGAFMFGLFDCDSHELKSSFETLKTVFDQPKNIGLPRYENDSYHRAHAGAPSNFWPVTTLWYAQYCFERSDTEMAERILDWVERHYYESGIIAEQISPESGYSLSVAPLAWSHAEYMATVLDSLQIGECPKKDSDER
ncbi:hypothetical protein CR956_00105, partial [Candidatus Saccharibacteria bacterium]